MLLRPSGTRRYPLALISHGTPREGSARAPMSPYGSYRQALEFARRGFAALVFMRRGYGDSGGQYAESSGPCDRREYLRAASQSASDLHAAIEAMRNRTDVSTNGMIAVGVSAGGFASLALTADPPPGLAAAINFAGGRGSRADNDVCDEDALVRAFATLGKTSRIPTLWIYAQNDKFFGPELVRRMHIAFTGAGGRAQFIDVPPFGDDGHSLFSRGISLWTPMVDSFLRDQNLGTRDIAAIADAATAAIARQGARGICRLSLGEPAPCLCRLAKGSFRFPQRAALDAGSCGGCPHRLRGVRSRLRAICGRRPSCRDRQRRIALNISERQACRSGVDTVRPSRSSLTLIWHDRREFGRTSKPKSSMSSSIGVGAPTFSRQASST
jgi:dienelactone hydrolase